MKDKLKFLLLYFLVWLVIFFLARLVFVVYNPALAKEAGFANIALSFFYGLRMDASATAYLIAPACLMMLLSLVIPYFNNIKPYKVYSFIVFLLVSFIVLSDGSLYEAWGFRIDDDILVFLANPKEVYASISHLPLFWITLFFIAIVALCWYGFKKVLTYIFFPPQYRFRWVTALVLLAVTASLIIPIRGGLQLAPMNQSSVYFSTNSFANHSAINAVWNFVQSTVKQNDLQEESYHFMGDTQIAALTDSLYAAKGEQEYWINTRPGAPVNVLLIIWESFTEKAIHAKVNGEEVTPNFNRLKQEGIYFSNIYASGDRTSKGVPAILSGYPALPVGSVIQNPAKSNKLQLLSGLYKQRGYSTPFFYGGEPEFANIKSYLLHGGYDPIIDKSAFAAADMNSKWGAHDGVVAQRVLLELQRINKPFFGTWLTLSSHEPFETPVPTVIHGEDITNKFLNSLHYTDAVIGDFIEQCKKQAWWNNTVIVMIGDHGHPKPETGHRADNFRTPMLWLGGALKQTNKVVTHVGSQIDLATTLSSQFGIGKGLFPFSKNLADSTALHWASFNYKDGLGFATDSSRLIFDIVAKRIVESIGDASDKNLQPAKAIFQKMYEDYLKK